MSLFKKNSKRKNNGILCKPVLEAIERGNVTFIEADSTYCLMNQSYNWFNSTDSLPINELERLKQLNSDCPFIPGYGNCTCEAEQMPVELRDQATRIVQIVAAKVDCSNMGLISLPPTLPANTISLNVSNNSVSHHLITSENLKIQILCTKTSCLFTITKSYDNLPLDLSQSTIK